MTRTLHSIAGLLVVGGALVAGELRPPEPWSRIHDDMSRESVVEICGQPSDDMTDIKGAFWFEERPWGWFELNVWFGRDGRARQVSVTRYIGSHRHFQSSVLRSESLPETGS